jgi:OmcA/MtrC family decaheme c-type cytochrome
VEIRLDAPDGKLFAQASGAGTKATGDWVADGQKFLLLQTETGQVLGETDVDLTVFGCAGNPPFAFGGEAGVLHSNWMSNPNRGACGSCHVDINWETGEGHGGGAATDDEFCSFCHEADSGVEFDRSVRGAHTVTSRSNQLPGVLAQIKEVRNTAPGQKPTVIFSLTSKDGRLDPASLNRIRLNLSGPNEDFDFYVQENALGKLVAAGSDWSYTFAAALPDDATGSFSVGIEGRVSNVPLSNGATTNDQMQNFIFPIAVTDSEPVARLQIVDDAKCESCHANLSLHGGNRHDAGGYCQTCHMPDATDDAVRLEGIDESIHFKYMVHKIHRGADLENGYVVYGFGSAVHDYSHVGYPGDLRDCEACHVEDTYGLPMREGALPTYSPNTYLTEMPPMTATCLSCHDGFAAAAHADANTAGLGESCDACHGDDKTYSVARVHAR